MTRASTTVGPISFILVKSSDKLLPNNRFLPLTEGFTSPSPVNTGFATDKRDRERETTNKLQKPTLNVNKIALYPAEVV